MAIDTISFLLGGLLVAVSVLGGGIEVKELKIPAVGQTSRLLSFFAGLLFVGLAVYLRSPSILPLSPTEDPGASQGKEEKGATPAEEWANARLYQKAFEQKSGEGLYPARIQGKCESESEWFQADWKPLPLGTAFISMHAANEEVYVENSERNRKDGYVLSFADSFKDCRGVARYQATWIRQQ
jgi:Bacterial tandem repeat domain 1